MKARRTHARTCERAGALARPLLPGHRGLQGCSAALQGRSSSACRVERGGVSSGASRQNLSAAATRARACRLNLPKLQAHLNVNNEQRSLAWLPFVGGSAVSLGDSHAQKPDQHTGHSPAIH